MGKADGFLRYDRRDPEKQPVDERLTSFAEFEEPLGLVTLHEQANRCMDCGIPFCHQFGCPVHNRVPEWIDAVYRGRWRRAADLLHATINFPEVTGRVCPAPCEAACTLSINRQPVTIRHLELQIVERAFREGWIMPECAPQPSGHKVAVIGSGPAGLAAAQQLARAGHQVTVFEKDDRLGGLLRYGIPDFKLSKWVLDRRLNQLATEGVVFETGLTVGVDLSAKYLQRSFNAIVLALGAGRPRELAVPGRELAGVHLAVPYLTRQNRLNAGDLLTSTQHWSATGKHVVVIGGGDTGADCIGTARRQGAVSVTQLEILPEPPPVRPADNPWPTWPRVLRSSSSHEEGCERRWSVQTKELLGSGGAVTGLRGVGVEWSDDLRSCREVAGTEFELPADLVLLAMGFVHVEHDRLLADLALTFDERGNVAVDADLAAARGVFAAGDAVFGPSLVVRAIQSGRAAAAAADRYLSGF